MKKVKWALVGSGTWAKKIHAPCLAEHPDIEFVGVWSLDAPSAAALAKQYGITCFESFETLSEAVDGISFAIVPSGQAALAKRAMAMGKHVLLEKPASTEVANIQALIEQQAAKQRSAIFLTRLFDPVRSAWIREAMHGNFTHAEANWISGAMVAGSEYASSAWRRGAGIIWDIMPHILSQFVPVLGDVVQADAQPWPEKNGLLIQLKHASGARSDIRATLCADPSEKSEWIRFTGPQGTTQSPAQEVDSFVAYRALLDAILHETHLREDPLLRQATLDSAITTTQVMADLAARVEGMV